MGSITESNYRITEWQGKKTVWVDSDRIEECMNFCYSEGIDEICLSRLYGYNLDNIDFLRDYPDIKGLAIQDGSNVDIDGIRSLRKLRAVSISDNKQSLDYSIFPELEEIRGDWHPKMKITEKCRKLKHLYLWKFNPKSKDLTGLPCLESLEYLGIVQSPIVSTEGVGKYDKLRELELSYLSKLTTLCDMEQLKLELLDILTCRKLQNHEYAKVIKTLTILRMNDCGEIPSIAFIKDLPNLRDFRFVRTDVIDGDISPCLKLESAGFTSKRHFSHTQEQMNATLKEKRTKH